jgi:hypothetical protein
MTRKDYVKFASVLKQNKPTSRDEIEIHPSDVAATDEETLINAVWRQLAGDIADIFQQDNPKFDRARFLAAAGVA